MSNSLEDLRQRGVYAAMPLPAFVAILVLLPLLQAPAGQGGPATQPQSRPAMPAVAQLTVRAVACAGISTRRASTEFHFRIVTVEHDAAGILGGMREELHVRSFLGADVQDGKDAARRLLEFLGATPKPVPAGQEVRIERAYDIANTEDLTLLMVRPAPPAEELWVLTDAKGRRVAFAPHRAR